MRTIRIRNKRVNEKIQALKNAGFSAEESKNYQRLNGLLQGSMPYDQDYIPHDCEYNPEDWTGIRTSASGKQAHKIWVDSGLTPEWYYN